MKQNYYVPYTDSSLIAESFRRGGQYYTTKNIEHENWIHNSLISAIESNLLRSWTNTKRAISTGEKCILGQILLKPKFTKTPASCKTVCSTLKYLFEGT